MANVEKLSIALVPGMAGLDRGVVEGGDCATASEVVRDALPKWKQRRTLRQRDIGELGQLWAAGLASGPGRFEALGRDQGGGPTSVGRVATSWTYPRGSYARCLSFAALHRLLAPTRAAAPFSSSWYLADFPQGARPRKSLSGLGSTGDS